VVGGGVDVVGVVEFDIDGPDSIGFGATVTAAALAMTMPTRQLAARISDFMITSRSGWTSGRTLTGYTVPSALPFGPGSFGISRPGLNSSNPDVVSRDVT
jgi:hypothetical protein